MPKKFTPSAIFSLIKNAKKMGVLVSAGIEPATLSSNTTYFPPECPKTSMRKQRWLIEEMRYHCAN
jgi:hypothetical protein